MSSGGVRRDASSAGVLTVNALEGSRYLWLTGDKFCLSNGCGLLSFEVKAENDIWFCFHSRIEAVAGFHGDARERGHNIPLYEVVFGGWGNYRTEIKKDGVPQATITREEDPRSVIPTGDDLARWHSFWIVVDTTVSVPGGRKTVEFILGAGESVDKTSIILRWSDPVPEEAAPNFIGVSSWNNPVQFRSIRVLISGQLACELRDDDAVLSLQQNRLRPVNDALCDVEFVLQGGHKCYGHRAIVSSWFNLDVVDIPPVSPREEIREQRTPAGELPDRDGKPRNDENVAKCESEGSKDSGSDVNEKGGQGSGSGQPTPSSTGSHSSERLAPPNRHVVYLPDTSAHLFEMLLDYIYDGDISDGRLEEERRGGHRPLLTMARQLIRDVDGTRLPELCGVAPTTVTGAPGPGIKAPSTQWRTTTSAPNRRTTTPYRHEVKRRKKHYGPQARYSNLYRDKRTTDVTLVTEDGRVKAHRSVLAMHSSTLYRMFTGSLRETTMTDIDMVEVESKTLREFCYYCYHGCLSPKVLKSTSALATLLSLADKLCADDLKELCGHTLAMKVDVDSCCALFFLADLFNLVDLRKACMAVLASQFMSVCCTEEFCNLDAGLLAEVISGDDLLVPNEVEVFVAILRWGVGPSGIEKVSGSAITPCDITDVLPERTRDVCHLSLYVRFPLIPVVVLHDHIIHHPIILLSPELTNITREATFHRPRTSSSSSSQGQNDERGLDDDDGNTSDNSSSVLSMSGSSAPASPATTPTMRGSAAPVSTILVVEDEGLEPLVQGDQVVLHDKGKNFRFQPRRAEKCVGCLFGHAGDQNGVFFFIGTRCGTVRWSNPHKMGLIKSSASSPVSRYTDPQALVGRDSRTTCYTSGRPPSWTIDLCDYRVLCNYYTFKHDGSDAFCRNWVLEGSEDSVKWNVLRTHTNDETIKGAYQVAGWSLSVANNVPYRFIRVALTGEAADGSTSFNLSGLEIYGYLACPK